MAENTADDLFTLLSQTHPHYDRWRDKWLLLYDILEGEPVDKTKYLPRGELEPKVLYDVRVEQAEFIPESELAISKIIGAMYKQKPTRNYKGQEKQLKPFTENVDMKGTTFDDFVTEAAYHLTGYGCTRTLINLWHPDPPQGERPAEGGALQQTLAGGAPATRTVVGSERTLAEERADGVRPFAINYNPLSVTDWEVSQDGVLTFIRIKEERIIKSPYADSKGRHLTITRFIEYDQQELQWWDFAQRDKREVLAQGRATHGLGLVPMVCEVFPKIVQPLIGAGLLKFAALADVRKMRAESDLHYDAYMHAHPTLTIKTLRELDEIRVGSQGFIKLNPTTGEEIEYITPPPSCFEALRAIIDMNIDAIGRHTGVDPMGVLRGQGQGSFQTSGVSRAWSFDTSEGRKLARVADRMEAFERRTLDFAVRYYEPSADPKKPAFEGEVQYPDEFDTAAVDASLDQLERAGGLINSETLLKTMSKRSASSLAGELPVDQMQKIHKEIEKNPLMATQVGKAEEVLSMPGMKKVGQPAAGELDDDDDGQEPQKAAQRRRA